MNKALNYLGIARRAGFLISGTDAVIASLGKNATLVFVAKDASKATLDKLEKKCFYYKVDICTCFETSEIASATGLSNPKVTAITDKGITREIKKIIERGDIHESKGISD